MFTAAIVTFFSFMLLTSHMSPTTIRRLVGYKGTLDIILHATVVYLFMGTVSGLLQAECAAIFFSLYLRGYSWALGYERIIIPDEDAEKPAKGIVRAWRLLTIGEWQRYAGRFT